MGINQILGGTAPMRPETADFVETQRLDFEGWRAFLRASCGNQPEVTDPNTFASWVRPLSVCSLAATQLKIECNFGAVDSGRNAYRSERTYRDVRFAARRVTALANASDPFSKPFLEQIKHNPRRHRTLWRRGVCRTAFSPLGVRRNRTRKHAFSCPIWGVHVDVDSRPLRPSSPNGRL
jgi:hypothetical protein